jgi:hypothetical protein
MSKSQSRYRTHGKRRAVLAVMAVVALVGVGLPSLGSLTSAEAKPGSMHCSAP